MATGDFNDLKTKLNIRVQDTDNFTFTSEEKDEALTEAFNDDHTVTEIWDSSLTYDTGTYQYALPSGVDRVQDVYIKRDNSQDEPEKIASDLWEVVDGNLQFKPGSTVIPDGYTLYLKGYTKYTVDDTIAETNVQEFVLNLAALNLFSTLGIKKSFRFLKNDTTVAEIVTMKREFERKVDSYKRRLPTAWENA